jgi:hypothetical protein
MQSPPPKWLLEWAGLVGLPAALGALVLAVRKWLTRPMWAAIRRNRRMLRFLRKETKADSFDHRTKTTTIMGMALDSQGKLELLEARFEELVNEFRSDRDERKALDRERNEREIERDRDYRDRLIRIETLLTEK